MIILDTNSILRLVTSDLPEEARMVEKLIQEEENLFIPEVVFPEIEYNLARGYSYSREQIIDVFSFLTSRINIGFPDEVAEALKFFKESKLDMADCIVAAHAKSGKLASFDRGLLKVSGMKSCFNLDS